MNERKRWSFEDDEFVVAHYEAIGSNIGPWDLGRSKGAVVARAAELRKRGGWDAIERIWKVQQEYRNLMGLRTLPDDEDGEFLTTKELEEKAKWEEHIRDQQAAAEGRKAYHDGKGDAEIRCEGEITYGSGSQTGHSGTDQRREGIEEAADLIESTDPQLADFIRERLLK